MSGADSQRERFLINRRQLLISAGAVMASSAVSACAGGSGGGTAASAGLRYGEAGAFSTFNPWAQSLNQLSTANQMFSRLVAKTQEGEAVADVAESWELAPDGLSISITLRSGVKWHDGEDLVADDIVTMYGYLTDPAVEADAGVQKIKELFAPVTGVTATDDSTVEMTFSSPVPYALDLLNYWYILRLDDPADTSFIEHFPTGTGPYKMTAFTQESASFEGFADYYEPDLPKVDKFRFDIFAEGSNLVSSLQAGQIDGALVSNYAQVESLQGDEGYYIEQVRLGVWLLMVNASKPPFDNLAVRQALSWSMNREEFANAGNFGLEDPVTSPFYTDAATGYVEDLVRAQWFDLDMAASLLDSAGVSGLTINYPYPTSFPNFGTYGEIWQADLATIGVTLTLEPVSQGRWGEIGSGEEADVTDVVPWQVGRCLQDGAVFFAANSGYRGAEQRFGFVNQELEQLIAAGQTETDEAKRSEIYKQLNQVVVDQCTNISFATYSETFAWANKVQGPGYDLAGNLRVSGVELTT